ncbi:hypothetical protein HDU84_000702 [Entophlyctis sp. JEL0112]|nr:hypothetical protein HDU84_000702 [Entophlyctis sp. JEL0112]
MVRGNPLATSSVTGDDNPADFTPLTSSMILWILVAVFVAILAVLTVMCYVCNQRGSVARRALLERKQSQIRKSLDAYQAEATVGNNNFGAVSASEMAMITLSRNGIPRRQFSLKDARKEQTPAEAAKDEAACDPFVTANGGHNNFPVRRHYDRVLEDEISLVDGDTVVLTRVFRDGWAEGVSMRAGGPAVFPLACLGGGVPVVLAERLRIAQMARFSARPPVNGMPFMNPGPPPPLPPVKE